MTEASSASGLHGKHLPSGIVAVGTAGVIYAVNDDYVMKCPPGVSDDFVRQAFSIELRAYERLGNHPRIAMVRETTENSIVLERGECLRRRIQNENHESIALRTKLQWAQEAADGLRYIHDRSIIQADVGCHNMILDRSGHVKFIDFAGCGIDGEPALVCYEWCSYRPDATRPDAASNIKTDIFAFGSTLFEIESGNVPFCYLQKTLSINASMRKVEELFSLREYPNMAGMVLGEIITRCWDGHYETMTEVLGDIMACQSTI